MNSPAATSARGRESRLVCGLVDLRVIGNHVRGPWPPRDKLSSHRQCRSQAGPSAGSCFVDPGRLYVSVCEGIPDC